MGCLEPLESHDTRGDNFDISVESTGANIRYCEPNGSAVEYEDSSQASVGCSASYVPTCYTGILCLGRHVNGRGQDDVAVSRARRVVDWRRELVDVKQPHCFDQ